MKTRACEKLIPYPKQPVSYCECGKSIFDGRRKRCPACSAAMKKISSKRNSTLQKYATREALLAAIDELDQAIKMQEFMLQESKKRLATLSSLVYDI